MKKPERMVALSLIMVLALLVYRLAEHRLRKHLGATGQTTPNQVNTPTARPTMRRDFQSFEGIELFPEAYHLSAIKLNESINRA